MYINPSFSRLADLQQFYDLLGELERIVGGKRLLKDCHGKMGWPQRGVYFFFEPGEYRSPSGDGLRVVRVGTHALKSNGKATLWQRLKRHQGTCKDGGGNHRGSVFRRHVGMAKIVRDGLTGPGTDTWGRGTSASKEIRASERWIEKRVSSYIRNMPFLWVAVGDPSGVGNRRGYLEQNAIALLSHIQPDACGIDPPSPSWLGRWAIDPSIRNSGLWNVDHVGKIYDPQFLKVLEDLISTMK